MKSTTQSSTALSKIYTMACPHVCGDNSRALASGLSYVHVYIVQQELLSAKVGKGHIDIIDFSAPKHLAA